MKFALVIDELVPIVCKTIQFEDMGGRISVYVLLVCVWCSLDAGGLLSVVTAEPTVSAVILTPEADRKEGGQVDMRCVATNLESDQIVEWRTEDPWTTLRWGSSTITTNPRYTFHTVHQEPNTVVEQFTIVNPHRDDTDDYVCAVREPTQVADNYDTVTTSRVSLSVFYFPSAAFPVCFTSAILPVVAGAETDIMCSSEHGNSAVDVEIASLTITPSTTWGASSINNTIALSSRLTLEFADNGVEFECSISSLYFPNMRRSCKIGPIKVLPTTVTASFIQHLTQVPLPQMNTSLNPPLLAVSRANIQLLILTHGS